MTALQGLQVVITRPEAQALNWQQQLQALGAETYLLPVMQISPLTDTNQLKRIQSTAKYLSDFQKIIFVSQNAVAFAQHYFASVPSGLGVYGIGSATAKALRHWGLTVESASEAMNSEDLLQLPSLQNVQNQKILICRGLGGRETLATILQQRGAIVEYCELYQRCRHPQAAKLLANLPWAKQDKSLSNTVVSAHSGESVQWLSALLMSDELKANALKGWPLLVPGARVDALAHQVGFGQTIVAGNASDAEMTQSLRNWWQTQR